MTVDSQPPSATSADQLPRGDKPEELTRAERTVWRLANVEFPWDINKALEFAPSNQEIALATIDLLPRMYHAPKFPHPFGRQVALSLCEPRLIEALGFNPPASFARGLALNGLAARRWVLRQMPSPSRPVALKGGEITYPEGYNIEELGTFGRSDGGTGRRELASRRLSDR